MSEVQLVFGGGHTALILTDGMWFYISYDGEPYGAERFPTLYDARSMAITYVTES